MAMVEITDPIILDATGQDIVSKLDEVKQAIQPTNPCLDIDISLNASGWSSSSPYTYTYTNAHITSGCLVQCDFLATSDGDAVLHLDYEKVTNGVEFYAPTKPTKNIPVRIHVQNADATSTSATTADAVSTDAVSGTSNVQDALATLNGKLTPVSLTGLTTSGTGAVSLNIPYYDYYITTPKITNIGDAYCITFNSDGNYAVRALSRIDNTPLSNTSINVQFLKLPIN